MSLTTEQIKYKIIKQFGESSSAIQNMMVNERAIRGRFAGRRRFRISEYKMDFIVETIDESQALFQVLFPVEETSILRRKGGTQPPTDKPYYIYDSHRHEKVYNKESVLIDSDKITFILSPFILGHQGYVFGELDVSHLPTKRPIVLAYVFKEESFISYSVEALRGQNAVQKFSDVAISYHKRPSEAYINCVISQDFIDELESVMTNAYVSKKNQERILRSFKKSLNGEYSDRFPLLVSILSEIHGGIDVNY